ncbi:peptidoglycan recognition protein family protein [Candidatus Enterococcus murrayae]|uniref:N-acetylmuramoyl-L-alanine amidase n=1 Tax=Candidatus Enterococcus murrayae TaxID=2815321 RepID=A0ABS3HB97_9ENTE|nr:peptidoglycan recognition family protein [Enterococcus sp. MJM16]MBO0450746.1 N-acetylmuramoyl-L-alanine amidase [Enterococcus sp. MJM16]
MKKKITLLSLSMALFLLPIQSLAYTINNEFNLGAYEGDSRLASQDYIILHETGNLREPSARNEATYMRNNWRNAYTTDIVGDGGIVYRVGQWGYVSWGALNANPYAPVQIELEHTTNKTKFNLNYKAYIDLTRDAAKTYNIPLTLDGAGRGIKTHWWVTQNYGGDHVDPYGYLAQMGISKAQLQHDLLYGVGETSSPSEPSNPSKPTVTDPTTAGSHYSVLTDSKGNFAHVDQYGIKGSQLIARGWHIANYKYEYIFIIDQRTGKELVRVKANGGSRPDVNQAYKTNGNVGYNVSFNASQFKGRRVIVMQRATNDPSGNTKGGHQDFYETRWYHDIK